MLRNPFRYCLWLLNFLSISLISFGQKTPQVVESIKRKILADQKVASVEFSAERQTPSLILMDSRHGNYSKENIRSLLTGWLNMRPTIDELELSRSIIFKNNLETVEFQQSFKGIRVEQGRYKALVKNGTIQFMTGAWFDIPSTLSQQPVLTEIQALGFAKSSVNASRYAWEEIQDLLRKTSDPQQRQAFQKELNEYLPKGELVIIRDFTRKETLVLRLAYKFNIYATNPLSRGWIYVDAENGKILLYDSILKDLDGKKNPAPPSIDATVQTRYAGIQVIKTKQISGNDPNSGLPLISSHPGNEVYIAGTPTYVLMDDTRGNGIETYDLNGVGGLPLSVPGLYAQGKSLTDIDNNWTLTEHHRSPGNDGAMEAENDDIAWDAHWGAEVVYDYWLAKHNRLSFDGNNGKIKSFIHYGPAYDNAFWNGTAMTYGDGSGPAAAGFKALTSLDVCGHEIGHGVCSHTSDLVYASESGAMNEALSDIWAACIEHFAMTRTGSTVPFNAYRPFYIGEQIGSDNDHPLRRMDNPGQQGNPDTYNGINWINPVCSPTLVNDECGVHTNSGVLNKWFFLLTAGSKLGARGPGTSPYYFPDSDDEINDLGNPYRVNGLGFDVSENIIFITETLLTSAATYAEARTVSIAVANAFTGNPCDPVVESVTNAWYAVGVGAAFVTPCVITYGFIFQPGITLSETGLGTGCNDGLTFSIPILLPANSIANITTGGTAISGSDYTLSNTSLSNSSASARQDTLAVFIKNDAVVEADETIVLTVSVTNAGGSPINTNYTITIVDDDVIPVIGADSITLINETFTRADGFADPVGWSEIMEIPEGVFDVINNPTPVGKNQWGIFSNKLAVTGKIFATNNALPGGTYNNLSESKSIIRSPQIDARGLNTAVIHFDYTVQGEVDLASGSTDPENLPVFDYMGIVYSFDGTNFTELNTGPYKVFAAATPQSGSYTIALPSLLNNKQFYLGFRWYNDGNAGGPVSINIDNLTIKAVPRKIEKDLNDEGNETIGAGQDVYVYSQNDGELVIRVNNTSSHDFHCTSTRIEKAGNSSFTWYSDGSNLYKASGKIVKVIPTAEATGNMYTIYLYFSEAQISALEVATGLPRSSFQLHHTTAAAYSGANGVNTVSAATSYSAIAGVGGVFSASFSGGLAGSFGLAAPIPQAALPVSCIEFRVANSGNNAVLNWKVGDEKNNGGFTVERSNDGINYTPIGSVNTNSSGNGSYSYTDNQVAGLQTAYYKLKQTDLAGESKYICAVLRVRFSEHNAFIIGKIYPNPTTSNEIFVNITTAERRKIRIEFVSATGQLISWQEKEVLPGTSRVSLNTGMITQGSYQVRFRDQDKRVADVQSLIRY